MPEIRSEMPTVRWTQSMHPAWRKGLGSHPNAFPSRGHHLCGWTTFNLTLCIVLEQAETQNRSIKHLCEQQISFESNFWDQLLFWSTKTLTLPGQLLSGGPTNMQHHSCSHRGRRSSQRCSLTFHVHAWWDSLIASSGCRHRAEARSVQLEGYRTQVSNVELQVHSRGGTLWTEEYPGWGRGEHWPREGHQVQGGQGEK